MTIHQGRSKAIDMMKTLNTIFKGAGYQEISSNIPVDGQVYKTMGENGTSEFYIRLIPVTSQYIAVSVHEMYTPDMNQGTSGVFSPNGKTLSSILWSTGNTSQMDVDYIININKDRIIIFVQGEENDARSTSGLSYIGLPNRYGAEDIDGSFAGVTALGSITNATIYWHALKGRARTTQLAYTHAYYTPTRTMGLGDQLFASPIVLGHAEEGPRGELDDFLIVRTPDASYEARHKDTFVREGKNYILIGKFYNAYGSLPNAWYAMRI